MSLVPYDIPWWKRAFREIRAFVHLIFDDENWAIGVAVKPEKKEEINEVYESLKKKYQQ